MPKIDETPRVGVCNYNFCYYLPQPIVDLLFSQRPPSKLQTLCLTALYSLDAQELLADFQEHLPRFMLQEWGRCLTVLRELEEMGLVSLQEEVIELTHREACYRKGVSVVDLFAEAAGTTPGEFLAETEPHRLGSVKFKKQVRK
jgi:hypothetical protein